MEPQSEEDANYRAACCRITLQPKKEGFFQQLADTLASNIDFGSFLASSTDLERFSIVASACWDQINSELIFRGKNQEVSVQKRLEGNKYFENNDCKKALLCYTQSLIQAPVGPELASTYSNRSALLYKMGEYQAAIDDAELVIASGSLEQSKHKLYERMTSCYISLKTFHKAKVTARLAKHLAEKHDPTNQKFFKKLEKHSSAIDKAMKDSKPASNDQPKPTEGLPEGVAPFTPGPVYSNATSKFAVAYNENSGRFAIATEKISPGEVVLCEQPYAATLNIEKLGSHCTHCFVRFKVPIPCETCSHVAFCSRKCRKDAEPYHQYECKVMALLMGSGMSANAFLALRMVTQTPVDKFKEIFSSLEIDTAKVNLDENTGKYDTSSYLNIYNLGGLEYLRSPVDLYERTLMAVFLVKCLRVNQYFHINLFKNPKPSKEEFMIGSLILRNLQVLQFNAYEVCEFVMESRANFRKAKTFGIGLAIYPTASYFNHSCCPDVTRYFNGKAMVVQALRGLDGNQAICDNYGPMFTKMEKKERKRQLSGRYWFSCHCDACEHTWPLLVSFPIEIEPETGDEKKAIKKLMTLDNTYFEKGAKAMDSGMALVAIELYRKYIEESENIQRTVPNASFFPYKTVILAQEGIRICLCSLGSVFVTGE